MAGFTKDWGTGQAQGCAGATLTVPILDSLFGSQTRNLQTALSRTSERHSLLTNNLANVNVPGYKRRDVDFAVVLEGEQSKAGNRVAAIKSKLGSGGESGEIRIDGSSVDLENEVMSISESELRYQMLTEMTGRYFSNLKNVIREGK